MPSTPSLHLVPHDLAIAFEPMVDVDTALPFAYQANAADIARFETQLAIASPADALALDIRRATGAIHQAAIGGLLDTTALLALPISARHADPAPVIAQIFRAALTHGIPANRLVVMVSADEMAVPGDAVRLIEACGARGLDVALEDFVMGPIGVRLLARFTPRFVRLDAALVRNVEGSAARAQIIESVLRLARRTGIALAAPGVQSATELAALCRLGIRYMQGSWIAPPAARLLQPETASALPPRPEPRRLHTMVARRELGAAHRRLQHHRRSTAPRTPGVGAPDDLPALTA